jgi:hypothetical protein
MVMRRLSIFIALLLTLVVAPAAHAYSSPEVGIADDRIMLNGSDTQINNTVVQWQSMGVESVRIFARWGFIAPQPTSKTMPAGFDPSNPSSSGYNWGGVDRAVNAVRAANMKVTLTITGSGPLWGMSSPSNGSNGRRNPSPAKYAQFAEAVAKRYGGRVDTYILYNEPNQILWLQDQGTCKKKHKCVEHSPHVYRRLVLAAEPKVRAADPGSTILIGALAPSGSSLTARNKNMRPLQFLRAFGCVNKKYKKIRTGECKHFKPATADGFAYHPHGIRLAPNKHSKNRDDAQIGDLSRLAAVLDKVTSKGGIKVRGAKRFPLYLTEYAYQTNPPDKYAGVSPSAQAKYLRQGAYLAWKNSRVRNLTQYVYIDEPGGGFGWQSGLIYTNGTPKPSLAVFPIPFWAQKIKKGSVQLWGQVRPGGGSQPVQLQHRVGSTWVTIATATTDSHGFYFRTVPNPATTTYRAVTPAGTTATTTIFGR